MGLHQVKGRANGGIYGRISSFSPSPRQVRMIDTCRKYIRLFTGPSIGYTHICGIQHPVNFGVSGKSLYTSVWLFRAILFDQIRLIHSTPLLRWIILSASSLLCMMLTASIVYTRIFVSAITSVCSTHGICSFLPTHLGFL